MAPWWTCYVLPINISSHDGLLEVCSKVDEWRTKTGKSTSSVLCDVDLYYRMLKLQYNVTYVSWLQIAFWHTCHCYLVCGIHTNTVSPNVVGDFCPFGQHWNTRTFLRHLERCRL